MSNFTWVFDQDVGVWKNHALSEKIRFAATEMSVFLDHVGVEPGYGRNSGESVNITRVLNITEPTSAALTEGVRIPEDDFTLANTQITVAELGRAVPFTSLSSDLAYFDTTSSIQRKLREQLRLYMDTLASAAFTGCQIKYIPTGASAATWDTDGTASSTATANVNVYHLEEIRDAMVDTYHVPYAEGEHYIGIFRTLGLRGIKRDPDFEEWHKYTSPMKKFNSEVGMIEQIRLIETNHANTLGKVGTSDVLGEGVVFGEDAVVMAEAMAPELRAAIPQDFGRQKAVAWYAILGFDEVFPTANAGQARIVHVTSDT